MNAFLAAWLSRMQHLPVEHKDRLMLTGSLVTASLVPEARQSADMDYMYFGNFDVNWVVSVVMQVVWQADLDGFKFSFSSHSLNSPYDASPCVRCVIEGEHKGQRHQFQIDFFCAEPISRQPRQLTVLGVPEVRTCSPEDLWAWKLHGLVECGPGIWRAKDLYDLAVLLQLGLDIDQLRDAVLLAFNHRNLPIEALAGFVVLDDWGRGNDAYSSWEYICPPESRFTFEHCRESVRRQLHLLWPERDWLANVVVTTIPSDILDGWPEDEALEEELLPFDEQELQAALDALPAEIPDEELDRLAERELET